MRAFCVGLLGAAAIATLAIESHAVVINEIFADDAGGDTNEFIELFGQPGESLDGLSVIVIDNDNAGNTASSSYRRVNRQYDLIVQTIPSDGYYVLGGGPDLAGIADFPINVGDLQNGSQTYALVRTSDIAYELGDPDELTQTSVDAIAANAIDIVATWDGTAGDLFDFAPVISRPVFDLDAASRVLNGVDTDSAGDWRVFSTFRRAIELGDSEDFFTTPGAVNVPEPSAIVLVLLGLAACGIRRRL